MHILLVVLVCSVICLIAVAVLKFFFKFIKISSAMALTTKRSNHINSMLTKAVRPRGSIFKEDNVLHVQF